MQGTLRDGGRAWYTTSHPVPALTVAIYPRPSNDTQDTPSTRITLSWP